MFSAEMSIDFLWATYFGITKSEINQDNHYREGALACANRAYLDMCRRISFAHSSSEIEDMKREEREQYIQKKQSFRQCVSEYIVDSILGLKSDFDDFHRRTCSGIISFSNGKDFNDIFNESLNYGLAQKWLNMTIKNMLVMGLWNNLFEKYVSQLHVPIDSYILEAAEGTKEIQSNDNQKKIYLGVSANEYFGKYKWSQIPNDPQYIERYYAYQKRIRIETNGCPMEWEHYAWIEISKKK